MRARLVRAWRAAQREWKIATTPKSALRDRIACLEIERDFALSHIALYESIMRAVGARETPKGHPDPHHRVQGPTTNPMNTGGKRKTYGSTYPTG